MTLYIKLHFIAFAGISLPIIHFFANASICLPIGRHILKFDNIQMKFCQDIGKYVIFLFFWLPKTATFFWSCPIITVWLTQITLYLHQSTICKMNISWRFGKNPTWRHVTSRDVILLFSHWILNTEFLIITVWLMQMKNIKATFARVKCRMCRGAYKWRM